MLMDIVKNIVVSQDDFELAGEIIDQAELLQAVTNVQANVIVLGAPVGSETEDYHDLLYERPRMKIIVIAADGRDAVLHELQPRLIQLGDVAPASLIAAIRGAPEPNGAPSIAR
jgi:DNA-binding NarL/FixJ family response regulator